MRVFRIATRTLAFLPVIILAFGAVPIATIYELVTTGTIELFEPLGRRRIPPWVIYLLSWLGWLWFLQVFAGMLRYYRDPVMFRLGPQVIVIGGETLMPDEVLGFRYSFFHGHVLRSTRGEFPIHPWLVKDGVEALNDALPNIPPLKKANMPDWLLD